MPCEPVAAHGSAPIFATCQNCHAPVPIDRHVTQAVRDVAEQTLDLVERQAGSTYEVRDAMRDLARRCRRDETLLAQANPLTRLTLPRRPRA